MRCCLDEFKVEGKVDFLLKYNKNPELFRRQFESLYMTGIILPTKKMIDMSLGFQIESYVVIHSKRTEFFTRFSLNLSRPASVAQK